MTVFQLFKLCQTELEKAGKDTASSESKLILQRILGFDSTQLVMNKDKSVSDLTVSEVMGIIEKRIENIPLQYIFGEWDFYGETFKVGKGVLIPRPETEELCTEVIEHLKKMKKPTVFDLCSGSGCIGITLKKQVPQADVYLLEFYDEALNYLNENRVFHSVERSVPAIKGDVLKGYEKFAFLPKPDVIVSNPPYIEKHVLSSLQSEVQCEPMTALDGGEDGLDFYRAFSEKWLPCVNDGGFIAVECGENQAEKIAALFSKHSDDVTVLKDFNGIDRFVFAGKG